MGEFLAEDNPCGRTLVHLASRGNAIIAELLRLKDYIPSTFRLDNKEDQLKYGDIISDYLYFKTSEDFEKKIEKHPNLQELDDEFRDNNTEILERFFIAFESIHKYVTDVNTFTEELEDGIYIQQNLENLFYNGEGKQLLCEILYLYGVMLLVLDIHFDGSVRERLLVSYYRYSSQRYTGTTTVEDVCKLIRSTGLQSTKRPIDYPKDYFKRIPLNEELVKMVISHLRTDDIYNQIAAYPNAEHRSTALSSQAAMLFVCLFFDSTILQQQSAKMREIVDKYFPDNWVVSVYMGTMVNIIDFWDNFKAAKAALSNTLDADNVTLIAKTHNQKLKKCISQTQQYLKEGVLNEDRVFDSINKLVSLCRESNVTLRWLILHSTPHYSIPVVSKRCKQIRDQITSETKLTLWNLLHLLLNISEFELNLKQIIEKLLVEKEQKWDLWKNEGVQRMRELSEAFSGEKPLTKIAKNDNLRQWFEDVGNQMDVLSMAKLKPSQRDIIRLLKALDEVQGFHQLTSCHQVSEYIKESRGFLQKMAHISSINEDVLVKLQIIGDISYAWNAIDDFTALMQDRIKTDPTSAIKLRATFLKLSSALEIPLLRINQASSEDLVSVSQYYSQELVSYIRKVLHIIPETMFQLMAPIINLQTNIIKEIPSRVDKDKVKEYAQLEDRMEVARLTHDVSILSEGILRMKSTLVGIMEIDPKKLLEDGIRRELVKRIATALHNNIQFNSKSKVGDLHSTLKTLSTIMDGYRRSLEYIQDYISIYGLKIWQEELSRIIGYNIETECNLFLRNKIQSWRSNFQNKVIPVPEFPSIDGLCVNFIGRLLKELIRITDPKVTTYVEDSMTWFDIKTQNEVLNFKVFNEMRNSISVAGLTGLDRLICFTIVTKLQALFKSYQKEILGEKSWIEIMCNAMKTLTPCDRLIENPSKTYGQYLGKFSRTPSVILDSIMQIGQLQVLRKLISYELEVSCKFDSKQLYSCLETMNEAMMNEFKMSYQDTSSSSKKFDNQLTEELYPYLDWAGIGNPYAKIYVTTSNMKFFPVFLSLFTLFQLLKLQPQKSTGHLIWKKYGDAVDGFPLIIGLQTVFRQFNPNNRSQFLLFTSQYIKSYLAFAASCVEKSEIPSEISTTLLFFNSFCKYSGLTKSDVSKYVSDTCVHLFETLNT